MSQWRAALRLLWDGREEAAGMPAAYSTGRDTLQAAIDRLRQVEAAAARMRTEPDYAHVLIRGLHAQLAKQFPDVPASICSEILRVALDPRF